ncbi:MAG TPA: hypothetical protein PK303_02635 [bacterium]|nr:hypothetical protein [bacterium]HOL34335.1 hypothetical protein [bacterium]HPP08003.1 hypothetical protein [bacterium]
MKKGYVLPMAIIFVIVALIMGMGILYLGGNEQIAAMKRYHKEKSFYIAEAGANWAFANKRANESWHPPTNPVSFGGGTFVVSESVQGETIVFISTGRYGSQETRISVTTYRPMGSGGGAGGSFGQGLFGHQSVTIYNNAWVDSYDSRRGPYGPSNRGNHGDTGSKGTMTLYNNAHIYGTAMVEDGPQYLYLGNGATVSDSDLYHSFDDPLNNLPDVTVPSDLMNLPYPVQGDSRITGNYTISNGRLTVGNNKVITISGGDFRFKSITLNNNSIMYITGNTRFYIESSLTLSNNTQVIIQNNGVVIWYLGNQGTSFTPTLANNSVINNTSQTTGNLRIYVASSTNLTLANNAQAFNGVIYAPTSSITLANNSQFFGGIVSNNLTLINNAIVHYDVALREISFPEDPGLGTGPGTRIIVRWTKPDWSARFQ